MEAIYVGETYLEVFVAGKEFFVLLRPNGMLAKMLASNELLSSSILVKKGDAAGAVIRFPADSAPFIFRGIPQHACDDRLRYIMAAWAESYQLSNPVSSETANPANNDTRGL